MNVCLTSVRYLNKKAIMYTYTFSLNQKYALDGTLMRDCTTTLASEHPWAPKQYNCCTFKSYLKVMSYIHRSINAKQLRMCICSLK